MWITFLDFFRVAKINMPEDFKTRIKSLAGFSDLKITIGAPLGYDAAKVAFSAIANSIKKGKLDGLMIKEELKNSSYKGVSSPLIEFDENGDLKTPVFEVKVIKDKKSVPYSD